MNMETKNDIFNQYKEQYFKARAERQEGGRERQKKILDIVCDVTGMHRKAAIRKFCGIQTRDPYAEEKRGRSTYYTPDCTAALKDIYDASNSLCGELLHPVISEYVCIFKRDGTWKHGDEATGKLLAMSMRTAKRRVTDFEKTKRKGQGFSSTSPSDLKTIIPISVGEWKDVSPGVVQVDTVAHCGTTLKGDFIYTLNVTDVAILWNRLRAQWNKGKEATLLNLEFARVHTFIPLLRRHSDTGSEFINYASVDWGLRHGIDLTRSRPYKKNDNPHVEERNAHVVRKYVGYIRLDAKECVDVLNELYGVLNLYTNHFIPSRRTIETVRHGAIYKRTYENVALAPYRRLMRHEKISQETKDAVAEEHSKLNPAVLLKEIERLRGVLYDTRRKHGAEIQ